MRRLGRKDVRGGARRQDDEPRGRAAKLAQAKQTSEALKQADSLFSLEQGGALGAGQIAGTQATAINQLNTQTALAQAGILGTGISAAGANLGGIGSDLAFLQAIAQANKGGPAARGVNDEDISNLRDSVGRP